MKRILLILLLSMMALALIAAGASNGYGLDWWTVDGGGVISSSGGTYTLSGSIGQPDAGLSTGGDYTLGGGFWGGGALHQPPNLIFLPIAVR